MWLQHVGGWDQRKGQQLGEYLAQWRCLCLQWWQTKADYTGWQLSAVVSAGHRAECVWHVHSSGGGMWRCL